MLGLYSIHGRHCTCYTDTFTDATITVDTSAKWFGTNQFSSSNYPSTFFLKWAIPGLFFFIFVFSTNSLQVICSINVAYVWIRTRVLWYRKWTRFQLCHNHCPSIHQHFIAVPPTYVNNLNRLDVGKRVSTEIIVE